MEFRAIFRLIIISLLAISTSSFAAGFPLEALPPHIALDLPKGERPDWAPTGSDSYIFIDSPGGKPFEKNRLTGELRSILPPGCNDCRVWRAYYLPNRDFLMTIGVARDQATIHIIDGDLETPAWNMGVVAHEGVAVSRHSFQLAWSDGADIYFGDLIYGDEGVPTLENRRVILNVDELKTRDQSIPGEGAGATVYLDYHEPQNWRPPHDRELIFSRYGTSTTGHYSSETWMWNMDTDAVTNLSNRHAFYDEPEGIFPDGEYTLVECDMFLPVSQHAQVLDLYRMKIDGSGEDMLRLTYFGDYKIPGSDVTFKANQGVISEDGKYMLFGEGRSNTNDQPGAGFGIYLFDFAAAGIEVGTLPEPDTLGKFDLDKDLYLAHFDVKTDVDDVHSVAGVATMLADPRFSKVRYHAVAGTYGIQEGLYVPAERVFDLAFGDHWSDAHGDFDKALNEVLSLSIETLNDEGSIWIADGGQSDFSAALIRKIQELLPGTIVKDRVHVVQHADWNEEVTTAEDLDFVKSFASYQKIPDGNAPGNGSPGFRSKTAVNWQAHVSDGRLTEIWTMAVEIANQYNGADGRYLNKAIQDGGLDFSDVAETTWIFGFNDLADANDFFEEFTGTKPR